MRNRRLLGTGLAALALGLGPVAASAAVTGLTVTSPHAPRAVAGEPYSFAMTATGGQLPYRWRVTADALPAGLALSSSGILSSTARATARATGGGTAGAAAAGAAAAGAARTGHWSVTVAVTDARGATATAGLSLLVAAPGPAGVDFAAAGAADSERAGNLRYAEWAWHRPAGGGPVDKDG